MLLLDYHKTFAESGCGIERWHTRRELRTELSPYVCTTTVHDTLQATTKRPSQILENL